MITTEGIVIIIGWLVSLGVAIMVVPRLAAQRVCSQFGLTQVNQDGHKIFAVVGPDGEAMKVPIGIKGEGDDQQIIFGYAGLGYTLPYLAAEMAAQKVKMGMLNVKSGISKKLSAEALKTGDLDSMEAFLPKKVQVAIALAKAFGLGGGGNHPATDNPLSRRPGGPV